MHSFLSVSWYNICACTMMEDLTFGVLERLKNEGYNVLISDNTVDDELQVYTPIKVEDVWNFLEGLDGEQACLVINDVLTTFDESTLHGKVQLD